MFRKAKLLNTVFEEDVLLMEELLQKHKIKYARVDSKMKNENGTSYYYGIYVNKSSLEKAQALI